MLFPGSIIPIEQSNCLHSCKELLQEITFIWRMNGIPFKSKAHKKRIYLKNTLKIGKDRNGTATT